MHGASIAVRIWPPSYNGFMKTRKDVAVAILLVSDDHCSSLYVSYYLAISIVLTHWGRDKMSAKFADDIFKYIFSNENVWVYIKIS